MRTTLLIGTLIVTLISCNKTENKLINSRPEIPKNDSIDINFDGIIDLVITYWELETTDVPSSGGSIIGGFMPMEQNRVLYRPNIGYLFLQSKDTIRNEFNSNSQWTDYTADMVNISRNNSDWNTTWSILSNLTSDYYLGFMQMHNSVERIGWIQVEIDTISGKMSILDSKLTDSSEIILE